MMNKNKLDEFSNQMRGQAEKKRATQMEANTSISSFLSPSSVSTQKGNSNSKNLNTTNNKLSNLELKKSKHRKTKLISQEENTSSKITRMRQLEDEALQIRIRRKSLRHNQNILQPTTSTLIIFVIISSATLNRWLLQLVDAQCMQNTQTTFERIGGVTVKESHLTLLYTAPNITGPAVIGGPGSLKNYPNILSIPDLSRQLSASSGLTINNIPITAECNNRCRRDNKCRGFLVDYARHTCYSVDQNPGSASSSGLMRSQIPLIQSQDRTAYFERICLNYDTIKCERAWVYERVLAHHIQGHDDKTIEEVPSRLKCQQHCLNEREFKCRSGEYDHINMVCKLSMIDRHIKPNSFRPTTSNIDYFENQCVSVGNQCDAYDRFEDLDLGRAEIMRFANTSDQCQQLCTQTKAFICRSFTWNPLTGNCYLNSANSFTVGGLDRLISAPGLTYYQRNDCIDLKLECDTNAMTLNLRTAEPFRGRMYVRDDPNACETMGRSSLLSTLSIPFQSHARCATRELPSRYSSVVVVQQHPLIQRKSDRYIKVVCDFQTSNKTITSTYNVVANPWTSTALINSTSFAPKIRLRITDRMGVDITGAKLGDELYLRIEAESESVYDMVARSVLAKSGTTEESIALIDKDGCPTDFRIFPPLKKLNRRTIVGKFDAFKFSSDVVVRFQVDVQFCLNQCPMTTCDHNLLLNSQTPQLASGQVGGAETYSAAGGSASTLSPQLANNSPAASGPILSSTISSGMGGSDLMPSSSSSTLASTSAPHVPFHSQHHHSQRTSSDIMGASANGAASTSNQKTTSSTSQQQQQQTNNYSPGPSSFSDAFLTQAATAAASPATHNEPIYYNSPVGPHHNQPASSSLPNELLHHHHHHHHHHQSQQSGNSNPLAGRQQPNNNQASTSNDQSSGFLNNHSILDSLADPQIFDAGVSGLGPALNTRSVSSGGGSKLNGSNTMVNAAAPVMPPLNALGTPTSSNSPDSKPRQRRDDDNEQTLSNSDQSIDFSEGDLMESGSDSSGYSSDQSGGRRRRRRRSARSSEQQSSANEVQVTKHVPLQREIIVIESSGPKVEDNELPHAPGTATNGGGNTKSQTAGGGGGGRQRARGKKAHSSGPVYDLNANKAATADETWPGSNGSGALSANSNYNNNNEQQQVDNGTLLCTTRHSLVLATVAFCTIQFITIVLCLVTWMHKKDAKFKVKHPIEERLY